MVEVVVEAVVVVVVMVCLELPLNSEKIERRRSKGKKDSSTLGMVTRCSMARAGWRRRPATTRTVHINARAALGMTFSHTLHLYDTPRNAARCGSRVVRVADGGEHVVEVVVVVPDGRGKSRRGERRL
jgi:hypothetical protein